jgi:NADH dehydrogenase
MEVWLGPALGFDYANRKARIYGSGTKPVSWISYRDVAAFCVESLYRQSAERATIEIGGPEALSQRDVVKIFQQTAGAPFELEEVPETALRSGFAAATDPMQKSFAGLTLTAALGDAIDMAPVLAKIPLPLTSVREYARAVLGIAAAPSS